MPVWGIFVAMILLIMGLVLLILGAFATYFGSGKVRSFGAVLAVLGVVIGFLSYVLRKPLDIQLSAVIYNGFIYLISAIIGGVIALLIFLAVLLKS